jgi:hypothetical protein
MNGQNNGIQKWIERITATVLSGVAIAFLTGRINYKHPIPGSTPTPTSTPSISPPVPSPPADGMPQIDRGNVETYFSIEKIDFKKGFENGNSRLVFLAQSKNSFSGKMWVKKYDQDGVQTWKYDNGFREINWQNKGYYLMSPWSSGERDRAYFDVEPNISKVELYFEQTR